MNDFLKPRALLAIAITLALLGLGLAFAGDIFRSIAGIAVLFFVYRLFDDPDEARADGLRAISVVNELIDKVLGTDSRPAGYSLLILTEEEQCSNPRLTELSSACQRISC